MDLWGFSLLIGKNINLYKVLWCVWDVGSMYLQREDDNGYLCQINRRFSGKMSSDITRCNPPRMNTA